VIKDDKFGYAFTQDLSRESLRETARAVSTIAEDNRVVQVPFLKETTPTTTVIPMEVPLDKVSDDEKISVIRSIHDTAFSYSPEIKTVRVSYSETLRYIKVINSEGIFVSDFQPILYIRVDTVAERAGERASGHKRAAINGGFELFDRINPDELGRAASKQAKILLTARDTPAGEFPVVIEKGWGGVLFHEAVGHGLEGDTVAEGSSYYAGRLGETVASPLVTLVDDGTLKNARGSFNFDDEGTPSQYTVLIEKGRLIGFMTHIMSAKKLGLKRTGNGRRESYRYPPLVRMRNTYILPGDAAPEDVLKSTKKGVYCREFTGGAVDSTSGNFTFTVREGWWIENGKLTYPLKGVTIIGNGPEALKRIDMVARDFDYGPGTCGKGQWVPVTTGEPTLRISKITVGGQT